MKATRSGRLAGLLVGTWTEQSGKQRRSANRERGRMATILVTGATGFIGSHLIPELVERGHAVRAMTRHPDDYEGPGDPVAGDVNSPETLVDALDGVDVAYYLVHSLDSNDFEKKDASA